jgi:hypothetical protein
MASSDSGLKCTRPRCARCSARTSRHCADGCSKNAIAGAVSNALPLEECNFCRSDAVVRARRAQANARNHSENLVIHPRYGAECRND